MQIEFDDAQFEAVRQALLGAGSDELIDAIFRLRMSLDMAPVTAAAIAQARALGWVTGDGRLTPLGYLVADPIREYRLWVDRGRCVHAESHEVLLQAQSYRGKDVLEPGSGFGCNLFSIQPFARRVVGLEPVAVYRAFTGVFATREGIPIPEVVGGRGEQLPFADAEFDIVLCYSAHQYMDVRQAFREMARVLRPGGQVQIIGGTLDVYRREQGRHLRLRALGQVKDYCLTIANTLCYERFGRRLATPRGLAMTTAPIYPRPSYLDRWLRDAGLQPRADLRRRIDVETLTVAEKPR